MHSFVLAGHGNLTLLCVGQVHGHAEGEQEPAAACSKLEVELNEHKQGGAVAEAAGRLQQQAADTEKLRRALRTQTESLYVVMCYFIPSTPV